MAGTGEGGTGKTDAKARVTTTGVSATGQVGQVLVWGSIVPDQDPLDTTINTLQTPSWTDIAA